jgi:hypothetical protein
VPKASQSSSLPQRSRSIYTSKKKMTIEEGLKSSRSYPTNLSVLSSTFDLNGKWPDPRAQFEVVNNFFKASKLKVTPV